MIDTEEPNGSQLNHPPFGKSSQGHTKKNDEIGLKSDGRIEHTVLTEHPSESLMTGALEGGRVWDRRAHSSVLTGVDFAWIRDSA